MIIPDVNLLPYATIDGFPQHARACRVARVLDAGPGHCDIALSLLETLGTASNLTTGAQIAAYAIEYGAEVHTADADFGRFPHVRWSNPLR